MIDSTGLLQVCSSQRRTLLAKPIGMFKNSEAVSASAGMWQICM